MIRVLVLLSIVALSTANLYLRRDDGWGNGNNGNNGYGKLMELRGLESRGYDRGYDSKDDYSQPIPYSFGYDVKDDHGLELSREEKSDGHGSVRGSYSLRGEHGVARRVEYVADKNGFRAVVKTNEPGTAKSNPADVEMLADPIIVDHGSRGWKQESRGYGKQNLW